MGKCGNLSENHGKMKKFIRKSWENEEIHRKIMGKLKSS
jgi:hypothetical protein